jgi:uncharacterized membrane protein
MARNSERPPLLNSAAPSDLPAVPAIGQRTRLVQWLAVALLVGLVAYALATYHALPDRLAVHFGADGTPNGWQSKDEFYLIMAAVVLGLNAFVAFAVPWLTAKLGERWINVLWKRYWFSSPARRAVILAKLATTGALVLVNVNAIYLVVAILVVQANRSPAQTSPPAGPILALICGLTALCLAAMFYDQRPPRQDYRRWQAGQ